MDKAGKAGCDLVAFGEALVPGYPHWIEYTDGAKIYSPEQKKIFAKYLANSVDIPGKKPLIQILIRWAFTFLSPGIKQGLGTE